MSISKRFTSFLLLTILTLQSCQAVPRFFNDSRPNFLIIITDDQRFDTMQYMPNTQSLIFDQGVTFSHGYVTTPFCCPSRGSILTGMYAHNHGIQVNEDKLKFTTVVEDLHKNGYYTGLVGKYLNSWNGDARPEYDYWVSFFGGTVPTYYDPNLNVNGKWQKLTGYMTYLFKDYVIEFLDKATNQRKPFLLIFTPNAPHPPYTPAKEDNSSLTDLEPFRPPNYNEVDMSDKPKSISDKALLDTESANQIDKIRRRQILTLIALDRSIGEILAKLKASGEMDNTVILFISDNGKHWGEHRLDSKSTAYEESVKVPFAIHYPALVPNPYIEDKLVANIDIAPTIYELSETPIPATVDGLSLVKLLNKTGEWRDHVLLEAWPDRGHWQAIHTEQDVYIETDNDLSEFYNLETDPYELDNMINDPKYQSTILNLQAVLHKEIVPRTAAP